MAKNMMCKTQKANSQDFRDNFDQTFRSKRSLWVNANDRENANCRLPTDCRLPIDIQYPEEIRAREIERKLRKERSFNG